MAHAQLAKRPAVSVVIPTFNGLSLLKQNLPSVLGCVQTGDEVIIVDDASNDGTITYLVDRYHATLVTEDAQLRRYEGQLSSARTQVTVVIIDQKRNHRFGATVNQGVAQAQHKLVFVINNDVKPEVDVLESLVTHFQNTAVFGVGCLELEGVTKPAQVEQYRRHGDQSSLVLGGKNKLWFERGLFQHSRADEFVSGPTGWVSGGSGLFDRQKWLALGGFDRRYYPAYWEDIDLSERARRRGWLVLFDAQAIVEHHHETTNQTVFKKNQLVRQSWWHSLLFTWRFGTAGQRLQMLVWLPYYVVKLRRVLFS